jgi:threonylcarbamoyladenosine tRNA methylthiotransferase MtaB
MKPDTIFIKSFGCKVNQYEGQLLREQLESAGMKMADKPSDANVCIVNSCTVTHNADADCRQTVRRVLRQNPSARIIVTGCLAISSPEEVKKISRKVEVYPSKEEIPKILGSKSHATLISYFHNHRRAFVKIQDGCDAFCSYCIVPYVRPRPRSKPRKDIFREIKNLMSNGYNEVVLCGIRLGKYCEPGDSTYGLVQIIKDILLLNKSLQIRLSSLEIKEVTDEFIDLLARSPGISRHLHIPLQSGDNDILKLMKRPYTSEEYSNRLNRIRSKLPDAVITTDIIVGFPGETGEQFENTLRFIKKNKFNGMHVFRYSSRPKTCFSGPLPGSTEIKSRAKMVKQSVSCN